ncbi:hypothetical protein WAB17_06160 [Parerythrobacter aurantius]|uniref:hypothetical protein n=1 Tax=Parerythrobacter aurantius TaxID=3127706 RepID=UPI00325333F1
MRFRKPMQLTRRLLRMLAREGIGSWVSTALVVVVLGTLHQAGVFRIVDGQLFDLASTRASGSVPAVVMVQTDERFAQSGPARFILLEDGLARLGAEKVGYLAPRPGPVGKSMRGRIVEAVPARRLPGRNTWELVEGRSAAAIEPAARIMAPAEYGIYRRQLLSLAGRDGRLATFEARLAGSIAAGHGSFYIPMPRSQSLPVISASQVIAGDLARGTLEGTVAIVVTPATMRGSLTTPRSPAARQTSEAEFRALAVQALRSGNAVFPASAWQAWLILAALGAILAITYHRIDPKRLALIVPSLVTLCVMGLAWIALLFAGRMLPLTALTLLPWIVTFLRMLTREQAQDRRLEATAARAVQHAFGRSVLREGARLPDLLSNAARLAGVGRSLVLEQKTDGSLSVLHVHGASADDIALSSRDLVSLLDRLRGRQVMLAAGNLVQGWDGMVRMTWLGGTERDLFWLFTLPESSARRKSAMLVRAIAASFRELFRWRANLNARQRHDHWFAPIDDKVASAISLLSNSSDQISHGFDTIGTAVMVFHMVGSPIHANGPMREICRQTGLTVTETSLSDALAKLTELEGDKIDAIIQQLLLHGGEMRVPMRRIGPEERMFRIAAPARMVRARERVIVLEAVDVSELHRAADLRQAVARFMDLQLRNDFEAIMLGAQLAADPRVTADKLAPIVARIADSTRRAVGRLDEVADLVRRDTFTLEGACYPFEAASVVAEAIDRSTSFAKELGVRVEADLPGASGFTVAEPIALGAMIQAMLRVLIADTPQGDAVRLILQEVEGRTHIRISGGFGIALERLLQLLSHHDNETAGDFGAIAEGMALAVQWDASVSYWGREADGFGFNIDLKRIG